MHRSGVSFTTVIGAWRQPSVSCTPGRRSYSAIWVGLGGYRESSTSLEQVGTEVDCGIAGNVISSAWYELPAGSVPISLSVRPGDWIGASVSLTGRRVVVTLYDRTTGRKFVKTLHARAVDVSSAEWIVEAPSECISATACRTLPLANFGSTTFAYAVARSTNGHYGAISDRSWGQTKIALTPGGRRFVVFGGSGGARGAATPSALGANGISFSVSYQPVLGSNLAAASRARARESAGQLFHSGR